MAIGRATMNESTRGVGNMLLLREDADIELIKPLAFAWHETLDWPLIWSFIQLRIMKVDELR